MEFVISARNAIGLSTPLQQYDSNQNNNDSKWTVFLNLLFPSVQLE